MHRTKKNQSFICWLTSINLVEFDSLCAPSHEIPIFIFNSPTLSLSSIENEEPFFFFGQRRAIFLKGHKIQKNYNFTTDPARFQFGSWVLNPNFLFFFYATWLSLSLPTAKFFIFSKWYVKWQVKILVLFLYSGFRWKNIGFLLNWFRWVLILTLKFENGRKKQRK